MQTYTIIIEQDGDGFLARVQGYDNLYARGTTKAQAQSGLMDVIDMTMDHYLQQAEQQKQIKSYLFNTSFSSHAV